MKSPGIVAAAPDFRTLFESSPDAAVVLSPDLTIVAVSDAYLRATGTVRSAIVGRNLLSISPPSINANGDGVNSLAASLRSVLSTCRPDTMAVQRYSFSRQDLSEGIFDERFWSPVNSPVLGPDGNVHWIIHRLEDVTELVRLKQADGDRERIAAELRDHAERMETEAFRRAHEVAQANRQLQRANKELAELYEKRQELDRLKTGFFASISEEFRAPLNLIITPVEDARTQGHGTLQGESLSEVYVNAMRLLKLVNSLLDFARVGQGVELVLEPTDLAVLTSSLVESFRTRVEQAGLELIVDCPANADLVYVDRPIWEKIVVNLVSHAFNTTFEGSLAVSMEWQHDRLVVLFRDTGIGIPAEDLLRIFEPFHRMPGRRSRTCEGTSIGLALVQELVRHHGGTIDVWSEEGSGTTFRVVLPTGRRPFEKSSQRASEYPLPPAYVDPLNLDFEAAVAASYPTSRTTFVQGHILVVDHDAGSRGYLYRLLSPSFRVSVAENGSAALAEVRRESPDLILSDVMIPVIDGPGLVRSLRDDPQTAMIPVILFSNRTGEDGIASCGEMGADDYLVGPFSAGKLLARVRVQLQLSRVRRAAADAARDLARSRATLLQKLEAKKRELESFSDSASRELRLPVQHDSGLIAILEREFGTSLDYQARNYLLTVTTAAREVETLFGNLLSFSRISQSDVKRTSTSLRSLVQEAVEQLSERSDNPPTQWILGNLPSISVDPEMLRVVLINLLSNALKFSSLRSKRRIEVGSTYSGSGSIVFYVRDNGVGFDMERAEQLFGVFQRLHTHEEFEGAGIGLAIVNRIIQRHGGRVWATSAAGEGAAFYCSLPNAVG